MFSTSNAYCLLARLLTQFAVPDDLAGSVQVRLGLMVLPEILRHQRAVLTDQFSQTNNFGKFQNEKRALESAGNKALAKGKPCGLMCFAVCGCDSELADNLLLQRLCSCKRLAMGQ